MANDFMTETPGSAVGDALQDILIRRKQAKQQDFLNQMQVKTQKDNEDYKNMQLQSLEDERKARAEQGMSEDWNRRAQLHGGEAASNLSPDDLQYGLQHGWLTQDHIDALPGGSQAGAAPSSSSYHWADTDKSRAAGVTAAHTKALQDLLTGPAGQVLTPLQRQILQYKIAGGEPVTTADFTAVVKPTTKHVYGLDEATQRIKDLGEIPTDASIERIPRAPEHVAEGANDTYGQREFDDPAGDFNPDGTVKKIAIWATPRQIAESKPGGLFNGTTKGIRVLGSPMHTGNETPKPAGKSRYTGNTAAFSNVISLMRANGGTDPMAPTVKFARGEAVASLNDEGFKQDMFHLVSQAEHGVSITPEDVDHWVHPPAGVSPEEYRANVKAQLHGLGIF